MTRTFKDSLQHDAENVFLNTDEFAYELTHRIRGDLENTETVTAIIDWDMTQETKGGAMLNEDRGGQRANQDVWLDVLDSVTVYEEKCQFVTDDGTVLHYVRTIGRDIEGGMKTLLCRALKGMTTRQTRVRS